jgi:ribosomal protein L16/L10AE
MSYIVSLSAVKTPGRITAMNIEPCDSAMNREATQHGKFRVRGHRHGPWRAARRPEMCRYRSLANV